MGPLPPSPLVGLRVCPGSTATASCWEAPVTGEEHRCRVPAGCRGRVDEVWLARVLPPGAPGLEALVMTTPYLLVRTAPGQRRVCLDGALGTCPPDQRRKVYPLLLADGEHPRSGSVCVLDGHVKHGSGVVFLTGFPDIEAGRPHARIGA